MSRLNDKVALITGAASGIGRASALRFASEGSGVMCADLDDEGAALTAAMIQQEGGKAASMGLNVTSESATIAALESTASELGGLQVLFNNAGYGAIELRLASGKVFRIGTDEPDALLAAVDAARLAR